MLKDPEALIEVTLSGNTVSWYKDKGYPIPYEKTPLGPSKVTGEMLYASRLRTPRGTTIQVKHKDVHPGSRYRLPYICDTCGKEFEARVEKIKYGKHKGDCTDCGRKKGNASALNTKYADWYYYGNDTYVKRLIKNNPEARCDISGESDKRFLVLHHLLSKAAGGKNEPDNYVILSANYHQAFHNWNGGTTAQCTPEDYYRFKEEELERNNSPL